MGRCHAGTHRVLTTSQLIGSRREREIYAGKDGIPWDLIDPSPCPYQ